LLGLPPVDELLERGLQVRGLPLGEGGTRFLTTVGGLFLRCPAVPKFAVCASPEAELELLPGGFRLLLFLLSVCERLLLFLVKEVLDELVICVERQLLWLEEFQRHQVVVKLVSLNIVLDSERVVANDVTYLHSFDLEPFLLYLHTIGYSVG